MAKAVTCPVCNGKGVVYGVAESGAYPTTTCHGCKGRGWVEVADDSYPYYPYPTYIPPIYPYPYPYTGDPMPNTTWRYCNE